MGRLAQMDTSRPGFPEALGKLERLQALWPEWREARCTGGNKDEGKALRRLEPQKPPNLLEAWWAQPRPAETREASSGPT